MGVSPVKRYFCYFATMFLILMTTNAYMGGAIFRLAKNREPYGTDYKQRMDYNDKGVAESMDSEVLELDELIGEKSCRFVRLAFAGKQEEIRNMLLHGTEYIAAADGSSLIRFTSAELHVEGYMATNKKLIGVVPKWHVKEDNGTIISGVEVQIEGEAAPQIWYIHYQRSFGHWKIYMLENGV